MGVGVWRYFLVTVFFFLFIKTIKRENDFFSFCQFFFKLKKIREKNDQNKKAEIELTKATHKHQK